MTSAVDVYLFITLFSEAAAKEGELDYVWRTATLGFRALSR